MKKYQPYIIILVILGVGVGYFLYTYSPAQMEKKESQFGVEEISKITKIKLINEKGFTLTIAKQGKGWRLNDKYELNEEMLSQLLTVIQRVEPKVEAPEKAQPVVLKEMAKQHTKCEIYIGNDEKPAKAYYVGGPTADGEGTFMIMEIDGKMASRSYVTHINGQKAYLTGMYAPVEERWRSRWIYRDNHETIQSVSLDYHREHQKSFTISKVAKDSFVIANSEGKVSEQPRQRFIQQYLDFYEALSMEAYENMNKQKDSILNETPFCTVTLKKTDSTQTQCILYYALSNIKTKASFDADGRPLKYDIEHYYGLLNGKKDMVLIQYFVWGKMLRSYDEFYKRPTQSTRQ